MKFEALIDGVHVDPKKGTVKIVLMAASHISLDELTTIRPRDENIWVVLESEQTKIDVFSLAPDEAVAEDENKDGDEVEGEGKEE